ncbi:MAG: acyloxyacyl hydrolase [Rhodospirillales bacterium]|nr:acyloxyacyl hydrolase [Rhodospirillales bacterium]MDH3910623.1 acyloxyacyl hydrolase [Rhodospirillales bacterium]MDH3917705.1 acyloxyacyl hydrolase [Rhodospirillales bacterium]MDH3967360.1 acyloxyacyl hydrolase [Rhodospirillales bacterium]
MPRILMAAFLFAILLGRVLCGDALAGDGLYGSLTVIGSLAETQGARNEGTLGGAPTNRNHSDQVAGIGAALGYEVSVSYGKLRAEVEFHYRFRFDFDENRPVIGALPGAGLDSNLASTTGLVNFNYLADLGTALSPYLGAGLGATYYRSDNELNDFGALGRSTDISTGTNFTWAVNAGILWQAAEDLRVQLGYRYIDMGEIGFGNFAGGGVQVTADYVSHDVILGLSYDF